MSYNGVSEFLKEFRDHTKDDPIKKLHDKHPDLKDAYERYQVLLNLYRPNNEKTN